MEDKQIKAIQTWIGGQMATNSHVTSSLGHLENMISVHADIALNMKKHMKRTDLRVAILCGTAAYVTYKLAANQRKLKEEVEELKRMKGE